MLERLATTAAFLLLWPLIVVASAIFVAGLVAQAIREVWR